MGPAPLPLVLGARGVSSISGINRFPGDLSLLEGAIIDKGGENASWYRRLRWLRALESKGSASSYDMTLLLELSKFMGDNLAIGVGCACVPRRVVLRCLVAARLVGDHFHLGRSFLIDAPSIDILRSIAPYPS